MFWHLARSYDMWLNRMTGLIPGSGWLQEGTCVGTARISTSMLHSSPPTLKTKLSDLPLEPKAPGSVASEQESLQKVYCAKKGISRCHRATSPSATSSFAPRCSRPDARPAREQLLGTAHVQDPPRECLGVWLGLNPH